jgi:glyoxylate utilization-related uncharacterized protein
LTNNNVPVNAGDFISVANINRRSVEVHTGSNGFGTPYTTFTFQVQDNGGRHGSRSDAEHDDH